MTKNFGKLNDLFITKPAMPGSSAPKNDEDTKQRTFKISNEFWDDFLILTKAKKQTQAELINELIKNVVLENQEIIEKYRELF